MPVSDRPERRPEPPERQPARLATLPAATPGFPWPPTASLLERLCSGLAHLG